MGVLERGGDCPAGSRGDANGPHAGMKLVLYIFPDWGEAVGLHGPSCLTCVRIFQGDLSTPIRAPLIMVSDSTLMLPVTYMKLIGDGL